MTGMSREEAMWAELVDEAGEALIEEAASVSVEQAEAELRAAGFDVEEQKARAEAFLGWLEGKASASEAGLPHEAEQLVERKAPVPPKERVESKENVESMPATRRKRRPMVAWPAAAAAVAASAALYIETRPPLVGQSAPPSSNSPDSQDLAAADGGPRPSASRCSTRRARKTPPVTQPRTSRASVSAPRRAFLPETGDSALRRARSGMRLSRC
jgi:hypothetical protein